MSICRAINVAIAATLLTGCSALSEYEDVSSDPANTPLIGRELQATSELLLHIVTLDRNYAKRVDLCSVTPQPGFDGREVLARRVLPAGTIFHVTGARRCKNCVEERVELLVSFNGAGECGQAPIRINRQELGSSVRLAVNTSGGAPN